MRYLDPGVPMAASAPPGRSGPPPSRAAPPSPHRRDPLRLALVAALGLAGCAPTAFQRAVEAGRLQEAAHLFAADSALQRKEGPALQMALLRATPGSAIYDPTIARAELDTFLQRFPSSDRRSQALRVAALLDQIRRLSGEVDTLKGRVAALAARADSAGARADDARHDAETLQAELRRSRAELHAVQRELAQLKAIDLRMSGRPRR